MKYMHYIWSAHVYAYDFLILGEGGRSPQNIRVYTCKRVSSKLFFQWQYSIYSWGEGNLTVIKATTPTTQSSGGQLSFEWYTEHAESTKMLYFFLSKIKCKWLTLLFFLYGGWLKNNNKTLKECVCVCVEGRGGGPYSICPLVGLFSLAT